MKMLLGFFMGTTVGLLTVLVIFHNTTPVAAESGSAISSEGITTTVAANSGSSVSPDNTDINSLMPDIKKIYNNALGAPYRQVESEITDPDIANYFRTLMDQTGLDKVGLDH